MKIVKNFQMKIVIFAAVKNRCILHGCFRNVNLSNNIGAEQPVQAQLR